MNKNMSDTLPVICENAGRTIEVAMGTTLLEVERQLRLGRIRSWPPMSITASRNSTTEYTNR